MYRKTAAAVYLWMVLCSVKAQSYGVLLGAGLSDMRAAGVNFQPGQGLSAGFFVPVYVNDRLVLRAEAGIAAYALRGTGDESSTVEHRTEADLTALGRYYVKPKISLSLGVRGLRMLREPEALSQGHTRFTQQRTDVCMVMGAAYRWKDRIETGLRYDQGLMKAADIPLYGIAHRRYLHVMMSYLLHSTRSSFAERRKWRSGLALTNRY